MRKNKSTSNEKIDNLADKNLKDKIGYLEQKNSILTKEIFCLKHELVRNNEKLKLKIKNTKNNIDLLNHHVQEIKSSKFIKLWRKITNSKK